jgi:hypothetical protein
MLMRFAAFAALSAAVACGSRAESAPATEDTAGRFDSVAAIAAATMDESSVFGLLDQVNAADSALGSLGAAKASATEVRDFGRMITREHHALRKDGGELAHRLGLSVVAPRVQPDAPPEAMRDALTSDSASAIWDRLFIDYAIAMHHSALENAARALAATKQAETREYIGTIVPILQKHLDKATTLGKLLQSRARPTKPAR